MSVTATIRVFALGVTVFLAGTIADAWELAVNGRPGSDADAGLAVALDPQTGSVFVGGNRAAKSGNRAFAVVKLNAAGVQEWQHVVQPVEEDDQGSLMAMALDSGGFLFAAGWIQTGGSTNLVVMKFDGRSRRKHVLWTRMIPVFSIEVHDIVVTPDGGVALAATLFPAGGGFTFYLAKFTSDGQDAWPPRVLSGGASGGFNSADALDVLPNGDLAVAGALTDATGGAGVIGRFDGETGEMRWLLSPSDPLIDRGVAVTALTTSPEGDVVVGVAAFPGGAGVRRDFTVIRLTGLGAIRWRQTVHHGSTDVPLAVAVAPNGDVVAGGTITPQATSSTGSFFVASLNGTNGVERWQFVDSGTNPYVEARAIAFDAGGNAVVTGFGVASNVLSAFTVVALDRDSGGVLWNLPIAGTTSLANQGYAIASDPIANVIVAAGVTQNERTSSDTTVTHITDGHEDWRQVITGRGKRYDRRDGALALAIHPRNGTLVMAGYTENSGGSVLGSPSDFSLVKIRTNGTKAWKYDYADQQPHTANHALAVAVSTTGDVFAGGRTCLNGPPSCFTVVRVDQRGHEVWRSSIVTDIGRASFVALDPQDGNVIAAGVLPGTLSVVKLDAASGAVLWTSSLNGSFGAASAATLTNRGTVAVARGGTIREFDTTNGILVSSATVPFSVNAMAFDAREGAIVVGGRQQPDPFQSSMAVAKIDAAGIVLWSFVVPASGPGGVSSIAVHGTTGTIAAAGLPAVLALDANGTELWRRTDLASANGVAFAGGNIVAVGQATIDRRNVFLIQAIAENGTEAWRRELRGTADFGEDSGSTIIVDEARAAIYAAGVVTNVRTGPDMFAVGLTFDGLDLPGAADAVTTTN